jgi:ADP-ribose pyrophosphatase YjhB (NUDIX family)
MTQTNPHIFQRRILFDLLFEKSARYSDLKPLEVENSQFMFHMKQLMEKDLVKKHDGMYKLTEKGKEVANQLDVESLNIATQAKITTVLCATRGSEILIYKRTKNPFFGSYGFPTQKVLWGENIIDTAIKGLKDETGLTGTPILFAIRHYKVHSQAGVLLEDKIMHGFLFPDVAGELTPNNEGEFFWTPLTKLKTAVKKPLPEFWDFYEALTTHKDTISFKEISIKTNNF